ncbi:MAG: sialate O-acetylesterase [Pseudomonadota bacterium]
MMFAPKVMRLGLHSPLVWSLLVVPFLGAAACGIQEHKMELPVTIGWTGGKVGGGDLSGSGGAGITPPVSGTGGETASPGSGGMSQTGTGGASGPGTGGSTEAGTGGGNGPAAGTGGAGTGTTGGASATGGRVGGATGGASGVTITIAGTVVPKEKAIVFIHFGHSNMQGQAKTPADAKAYHFTTQPNLWIYSGANTFVPAKEPTAPSSPRDANAGPGMALLKTAAAAAPADYHFISIGRGQGSAPSTDYLKGHLLYPAVMDRAMELKGKVTFGAIFFMLGITERHLPAADQPGFPKRIQDIIAAMRADLGEPNLPVLACDYEMGATGELAPTGPVGVLAIPMIRSLPMLVPNLVLVPTTGLGMQDDHHFDYNGQRVWGERAIMLMQSTMNWFPWRK